MKENFFEKIETWASDRNLILGSTQQAQMIKLVEEIGELAMGIAKNKPDIKKDSIGDCVVVLTILAAQMGICIEECIDHAWQSIKDRKGKMVNGIFIKEEDL